MRAWQLTILGILVGLTAWMFRLAAIVLRTSAGRSAAENGALGSQTALLERGGSDADDPLGVPEARSPISRSSARTRMRVLMLVENNPYPQDQRVQNEARALVTAGYDVTVISPSVDGQPRQETVDGVHVARYPALQPGGGFLGYVLEYTYAMAATAFLAVRLWRRGRFDVVHAHNPPDTLVLVAAPFRLLGARVIFDHHDLSPEMYEARYGTRSRRSVYRILTVFEILACRLAHHVIATNHSYAQRERERGRVPADRISIVRNGPDLEMWRAVPPDLALRQRAGTIIGYVGAMATQDGLDYLLRALRHLVYDLGRRDIFAVLIGIGDARQSLMALTTELGLDDYVWFTGWVSDADLVRYLSTADICVVPDPSNPFTDRSTMIKLMNYMALGKPSVVFDLPEHRVTAGDAAWYVKPNDEYAFAQAIARLMDDPERREALGARGRQRVETEIAWSYSIPHLLDAYQRVLARPDTPRGSRLRRYTGTLARAASTGRRLRSRLTRRNIRYYATRGYHLLRRYGVTQRKGRGRVVACLHLLARYGCHPTFPVTGRVVARDAEFFRQVQRMGAEIAVHGFDHVSFRRLTYEAATSQLDRAIDVFRREGIDFEGVRYPYLSYRPDEPANAAGGAFGYGSNHSVWWDVIPAGATSSATQIFATLREYYQSESADRVPAVPKWTGDLVEIPVSLPEDIQLFDGLKLDVEDVAHVWMEIARRTHARGELFVLMFHPELFDREAPALEATLALARDLRPAVWITHLRDVHRWWREKSHFRVHVARQPASVDLRFECSERATILLRGIETDEPVHPWDGTYQVLQSRRLTLPGTPRPFVGLSPAVPPETRAFLQDQGYILDHSDEARHCSVYLDASTLAGLDSEVALIDHIEASAPAPLVRFWRWPNAARSGLCLTGDVDALSLADYAVRVAIRDGQSPARRRAAPEAVRVTPGAVDINKLS